jgi:hypothetical protein
MQRMIALIASIAIIAAIPAVAAECANKDIDAARARWAAVGSQPANAAENEKACRTYAASFYESVTLRQAAAGYNDGKWTLALFDSVINAFHDLLATNCSG